MSEFWQLFRADLSRYGGNAELYIKVFHFLFRKTENTRFFPIRIIYMALFRIWTKHRGIEFLANKHVGGGYLFRSCL